MRIKLKEIIENFWEIQSTVEKTGPILENKGMCAAFQKNDKKEQSI